MTKKIVLAAFCTLVLIVAGLEKITNRLQAESLSSENQNNQDKAPSLNALQKLDPNSSAAFVNGKEIKVAELDQVMKQRPGYSMLDTSGAPAEQIAQLRRRVLENMVDRELLLQASVKSDLVKDEDLKKSVEAIVAKYGGEEKLTEALKPSGLTSSKFRSDLTDDLRISGYLEKSLSKDLQISDEEMKKIFSQSPQKYAERESLRAKHILIKVQQDAPTQDESAAKKNIDDIYARVSKPDADFSAIAKEVSQCPSAAQGGDLGYFSRGTMVPEFEKAAFSLKPGEVSQPIRTEFGYHIIKLEDKKAGASPDFEKAKPLIQREITTKKKSELVEARLKELRKNAKIDIKIK